MKKIIVLILSLIISIPFFTFSPSAASYDLITPKRLSYINTISGRSPETFFYYSSYSISYDDNGYLSYYGGGSGFPYFSYISNDVRVWQIGTNTSVSPTSIYSPGFNSNLPFLWATSPNSVSNQLIFASFVYEDLFLPSSGQYLKVTIRFTSFLEDLPSYYNYLINPSYFCYLCDDYTPGLGDSFSIPRLSPSSAVVSNLGNDFYEYSFYFNYDGIDPDLFDSDNVCLALRIPFYFSNSSIYSDGVKIYANCDFPTSYEILTIGGYNQEIESVEYAIVKGFDDLDSVLTETSEGDVIFLNEAEDKINTGKDVVNDYNDANDDIRDLVEDIVVPDVDDLINDQIVVEDDISSTIQDLMQNTYITSALLIVFSLCLISVILYGVRG